MLASGYAQGAVGELLSVDWRLVTADELVPPVTSIARVLWKDRTGPTEVVRIGRRLFGEAVCLHRTARPGRRAGFNKGDDHFGTAVQDKEVVQAML